MRVDVPPKYHAFVGGKTGLIKSVHKRSFQSGVPAVNVTMPQMPYVGDNVASSIYGEEVISAVGKAPTLEESIERCIGEALERYCLCQGDRFSSVRRSYEDARRRMNVVDADYLNAFDSLRPDLSVRSIESEGRIEWICGTDLHRDEDVWFPKGMTFIEETDAVESEATGNGTERDPFIANSSGWATAWTPEVAIERGLLERIERAAFLDAWYSRSSGTKIRVDAPAVDRAIRDVIGPAAIEPHFFELESPIDVPVVYCLLENERSEYPKSVLGLSAGSSVREAMIDALYEAGQLWISARSVSEKFDLDDVDPRESRVFGANAYYYGHPENASELKFVFGGETRALSDLEERGSDGPTSCPELLRALENEGVSAYAFDVTPRELARTGITVVKTYVPELLPYASHTFVPSRHPRFTDEMVEKPHPFL